MRRIANTKAAAQGGWEPLTGREKTHLDAMAAGAEGAGVAGEGGKESGVDLRFAWWARWLRGEVWKGNEDGYVWLEEDDVENIGEILRKTLKQITFSFMIL
jgi:hypothetical protein